MKFLSYIFFKVAGTVLLLFGGIGIVYCVFNPSELLSEKGGSCFAALAVAAALIGAAGTGAKMINSRSWSDFFGNADEVSQDDSRE